MITLLLVDDHPLMREGLASVLSREGDMRVVGEAGTGEQAVALAAELGPDIVLVDIRLPGIDGLEVTRLIRTSHADIKIIALTAFRNEGLVLQAFEAGANGFLVKESPPEILREAVRLVAAGGTFLDPQVAGHVVASASRGRRTRRPYGLTRQELRILELVLWGLSNPQIGRQLGVSLETVKTHLGSAMRKLQATDRVQAATIVARDRLV